MAKDVDNLTPEQMILKSIDMRLKRIETTLAEVQDDHGIMADDIDEIKTVLGILAPDDDEDDRR